MWKMDIRRFAEFVDKNQTTVLLGAAVVFILLSVLSLFLDKDAATAVYAAGAVALLVMALPGAIKSFKFGNLEMTMHRVELAMTEAKALTKLMAEIAIPLAHHTEGWASTAPSTIRTKDLVLSRAMEGAEQLGVEINPEIKELHYYTTCSDYVHIIIDLYPDNNQHMAIINKLKNKNIPTSIEEVEPPQEFRRIIDELGYLTDAVSQYLDDYQYYYENRKHRSVDRWRQRAEWSNDNAEPSESNQ